MGVTATDGERDRLLGRRDGADVPLASSGARVGGAALEARDESPTLGDAEILCFFTFGGMADASSLRLLLDEIVDEGVASRATTLTAPDP